MDFLVQYLADEVGQRKADLNPDPVRKGITRSKSCIAVPCPSTDLQELAAELARKQGA